MELRVLSLAVALLGGEVVETQKDCLLLGMPK